MLSLEICAEEPQKAWNRLKSVQRKRHKNKFYRRLHCLQFNGSNSSMQMIVLLLFKQTMTSGTRDTMKCIRRGEEGVRASDLEPSEDQAIDSKATFTSTGLEPFRTGLGRLLFTLNPSGTCSRPVPERSHANRKPIQSDFRTGSIWIHVGPVPCKHGLSLSLFFSENKFDLSLILKTVDFLEFWCLISFFI